MSRYQAHDSGESRRSPRDRSPASTRYTDSRDSNFNAQRPLDGQHRASIDSRSNTFSSRGEPYRDSSSNRERESGRDFSNRDPPRAPKALIEVTPPSGPRASSYGTDNFRTHGRGRARSWRDDSRDRGREGEYYDRDRRDERGGFGRGDRGRDRDWADRERRERDSVSYRGRRPSSPATGRSPSLRDPRDAPIGLDVDRTRRGSRDGPLSATSSTSDPPGTSGPSFAHGYGRARPAGLGEYDARGRGQRLSRGRGRGGYPEDRSRGRSRSPDRSLDRTPNPSSRRASFAADRSPPPQAPEIPAFGSVVNTTIPTGPRIRPGRPPGGSRPTSTQPILTPNKSFGSHSTPQESNTTLPAVTEQPKQKDITTELFKPKDITTKPSKSTVISSLFDEQIASTITTQATSEEDENIGIQIALSRSAVLDEDGSDSESDEDYDFEAKSQDIEARLKQASLSSYNLNLVTARAPRFHIFELPPAPVELVSAQNESTKHEPSAPVLAPKPKSKLAVTDAEEDNGAESEAENLEQLEAVRRQRRTPPQSALPFAPNAIPWWDDPEVLEDFRQSEENQPWVASQISEQMEDREREVQLLREEYEAHYRHYLEFCESEDALAIERRRRVRTPQVERSVSATPAAEIRPEGRRTASRWATEHDLERILRESEQDAREKEKEAQEKRDREAEASYREAVIPDMLSKKEFEDYRYSNMTGIVPFERSVARLELLPPIDDFTDEESKLFEDLFMDYPKQWTIISSKMETRSYKECIQHYYEVKHKGLSMRLKRGRKRKGRKPGPSKARANALMANLDGKPEDQEVLEWALKENGKENGWRPDPLLGERRRPRRAAAPTFGLSLDPSTAAEPTLARQLKADRIVEERKKQSKPDSGSENKPGKPKNKASAQDKASKQAKNVHPLIAAQAPRAPPPAPEDEELTKQSGNPFMAPPRRRSPSPPGRFSIPFDGTTGTPPTYGSAALIQERPAPLPIGNDENNHPSQNRLGSVPPTAPNSQPRDRRNVPQTSSYWSVPEQTDFPPLLEHYGTNWEAIANHMGSKTHIMVKNYYQRQVDSGRTELEEKARIADDRIRLGESTGPAPTPTIPIKRRYDSVNSGLQRPLNPATDSSEDSVSGGQAMVMQHGASPQPTVGSRFPSIARASSAVSSGTPVQTAPISARPLGMAHQPQIAQQPPQNRPARGPPLGYFPADTSRPILQAASSSHQAQPTPASDPIMSRSHMVAHEAQRERQQALLLEEQQQARQQQHRMKQETEMQNIAQYEQYPAQTQQPTPIAHSRADLEPQPYSGPDMRRVVQPPYQPRNTPVSRQISGERIQSNVTPPLAATPPINRPAMSAPAARIAQEVPQVPRPPPPVPAPARKSNIMSLLNNDPPEPVNPPPKRPSEPPMASQQTQSPAPMQPMYQQPSQPSRPASVPQPPHIRRESSLGDMRGAQQSYSRSANNSQAPMRVVESPYSAVVSQSQSRPQVESPRESALPGSYYSPAGLDQYSARDQPPQHRQPAMLQQRPQRQQQQLMEPQSATRSPQMAAAYHPSQSQQPSHRQLAFGQTQHHTASPPTQYAAHSLHSSRHNSFDGRHGLPASSVPPQPGYPAAHQPPASMQYQPQAQHGLQPSRFASQPAAPSSQAPSMAQQAPPQHQPMSSQPTYSPLSAQHLQQHPQGAPPSRAYTPQGAYEPRYGVPPPQPQPHHAEGRISTDERDTIIRREIMGQRAAREYPDTSAVYDDRRADEQYHRDRAAREREFGERERERARQYEERRYEESRR